MSKKFYNEDDPLGFAVKYAETKPEGFSEITDQAELSRLHLKLNTKLKDDGKKYTSKFKVDVFGVKYRDGIITDQNVDWLYVNLNQLLIRLEDGNYDSALYYLENHLSPVTQESINNGYTQEVHDKLVADVTNYIAIL